jgi:hypothetical protein
MDLTNRVGVSAWRHALVVCERPASSLLLGLMYVGVVGWSVG